MIRHSILHPNKDAGISPDKLYRYWLFRRIGPNLLPILFVGLNPSTADAFYNDRTITRCMGFAYRAGLDLMYMGNIYAYRATRPEDMFKAGDPVGPRNEATLMRLARKAVMVVAAWGANPITGKAVTIRDKILSLPNVYCLGRNKDGSPKHPLYIPADTSFIKL